MVLEIHEASPPPSTVSRRSPRGNRPVVRRSRVNSTESENSNGSRSNTPGPNSALPSGSNNASRNPSFRGERPPSVATSRRSAANPDRSTSSGRGSAANSNNNVNKLASSNGDHPILASENCGPRRRSMPNVTEHFLAVPNAEESRESRLRRVRSFKTTSKGVVVNRGDSFKIKSTNSLMSTGSAITDATRSQQLQLPQNLMNNNDDILTPEAPPIPTYYRVIMMGAAGCGKTLMSKQFLTSDYVGGCDDNIESHEPHTVSVLLDGEESTIEFIDPPDRNVIDDSLQHLLDAYVVVFAINDHESFDQAQQLVRFLRVDHGTDRVILLVANKIDLVRKRKVTADEARLVSETYDCKYVEISAALNHHMDELLVGILTQIRLHMRIPFTTISFPGKESRSNDRKEKKKAFRGPRGFFSRLFRRAGRKKPKPCENLYAL
ncbi:GTP-binding protein GEM-like [Biomphalaria glabrata]|uniref:GTP-binding protein GEM-like n=2 Tax=Biomphalaria glabrata TaxID=6526 RepID=A0A9W3B034_BIOGL|nr:GTP-binding protein GEM-like [Biomphalaria glabrata]